MTRKRNVSFSIRRTANISKLMRTEIETQGEMFEPTRSVRGSSESTKSVDSTDSFANCLSNRSQLTDSTRSSSRLLLTPTTTSIASPTLHNSKKVTILNEEVQLYDNDLLSIYDRTSHTASMCSMDEIEDDNAADEFEKKCGSTANVPESLEHVEIVRNSVGEGIKAEVISDFDLCLAMDPSLPHPQAIKVEHQKRFETEQNFCKSIISDIENVINLTWRNDLEMKIIKTKDKNCMPHCRIQLIRRINAQKMNEQIYKNSELYGFQIEENCQENVKNDVTITKISKFSSPIQTIFNTFSHLKNLFGFGFSSKKDLL